MKRTAFFAPLLLAATAAGAQKDTIELTPVEVQATRAGARAPFTKTNLSRADIEKANLGQDLPFVLNQVPNVVVNSDAGNGVGYTGIRVRGTDATRINVTVNGVPFNDPESSGAFFVNMPDILSSASSIQVQRGVGTSSNGPAAFGATINLSTTETNPKPYLEFNNSYGSFNTWKNTLRFGSGNFGKGFSFDGRLSRLSSDGYVERATSDLKSYYAALGWHNTASSVRFITFGGSEKTYQAWNGIPESDLEHNRRANYSGTERPGTPYDNETDNYKQYHYQLHLSHRLNPSWTMNLGGFYIRGRGFYEQYKAGQKYADYYLPNQLVGNIPVSKTDLIRQLWLDNHYYGSVFSALYRKGATGLTFGGQVSNYLGDHYGYITWALNGPAAPTRYYNLDARKNEWNLYGKWEQQLSPVFLLYTDLQVRSVRHRINGFRKNPGIIVDRDFTFFNPKAGIQFQTGKWKGYTSFGIANKEPNRDDFEASATSMPRAEQLQDLEASIGQQFRKGNWSVTFYYMNYRDQLVLTGQVNDVGAYTRTNIQRSFRAGLELEGAAQAASWLKLSGNLALSRNRIIGFTEYLDDWDNGGQKINPVGNTDISFSPGVTAALTASFRLLRGLDIDVLGKYVGDQYLDNTANASRKLDAYYDQTLRAAYTFNYKWLKRVQLIAQVNNLFDARYEPNGYTYSYFYEGKVKADNYYYPMAGRNVLLGLNVRL
ncbi:MAG: TonB-dependent receptor [Chitinophagaceae bacterium]|nr:MAG: TonB-dependent receptor [Chitinophagaceae bacterium]